MTDNTYVCRTCKHTFTGSICSNCGTLRDRDQKPVSLPPPAPRPA